VVGRVLMGNSPVILVVDDEPDVAEILGFYLEDHFTMEYATTPEKAIEVLKNTAYDLLITDLNMLGVDVNELIQLSMKIKPNAPILLSTGEGEDSPKVIRAMELGAVGILVKPFGDPEEVQKYVLGKYRDKTTKAS
tara:strand:- start:43 stop:450 length:408 start_codon:yes stop_codon:yes gene_type:complete